MHYSKYGGGGQPDIAGCRTSLSPHAASPLCLSRSGLAADRMRPATGLGCFSARVDSRLAFHSAPLLRSAVPPPPLVGPPLARPPPLHSSLAVRLTAKGETIRVRFQGRGSQQAHPWTLESGAQPPFCCQVGCDVSARMLNPRGPEALATRSCVLPRLFLTDFF